MDDERTTMKTMVDKEKPQATAGERLATVQDALGELPHQYTVEFVDDDNSGEPAVYLNFDFGDAVVISWDSEFKGFRLAAYNWAADHGVNDEHEIGLLFDADVAAAAAVHFARTRERD